MFALYNTFMAFTPSNILVPTDFSKYSYAAFQEALSIAAQYDATLHLLHVNDEAVHQCAVDYCISEEQLRDIEIHIVTSIRENLKKQCDAFPECRSLKVIMEVRKGVPYEEILKEQEEEGIDLIVIPSHGRTGFIGHLMGSVAERVTHGARCSVLLVKQ